MDQRDLEYISLFGLHEKEEHVLRLVRGCGDNHHRPFSIIDFILKQGCTCPLSMPSSFAIDSLDVSVWDNECRVGHRSS